MCGLSGDAERAALRGIAHLPPAERQVLAALAVVGRASLSGDELAELAAVEDVLPLVADLERRGLIASDERRRYRALGRVGEEIRQTDDALSTGERLLQYMTTLAEGGRLTPERLLDDAEAVLGLTEWAADLRQWERLLELVKTLQACFGIASRVEEWLTLLERGRSAAHALGDRQAEVWVLQQLAAASASAGDASPAQRYRREADALQRERLPGSGRASGVEDGAAGARVGAGGVEDGAAGTRVRTGGDEDGAAGARVRTGGDEDGPAGARVTTGGGERAPRIALWILGLVIAAAAGGATGYAIGNGNGSVSPTTTVTVISGGRTVTTATTVTLPPTTVLDTTTVTTTIISPPPPVAPQLSSSSSSSATP